MEDVGTPRIFSKWNLCVDLSALLEDPYEPLTKATLHQKSLEAVFLQAMATIARVSEIHALDYPGITHTADSPPGPSKIL